MGNREQRERTNDFFKDFEQCLETSKNLCPEIQTRQKKGPESRDPTRTKKIAPTQPYKKDLTQSYLFQLRLNVSLFLIRMKPTHHHTALFWHVDMKKMTFYYST